jgi:ethanolamine permease
LLAAVIGAVVICGIYAAYMCAVLRLRRLQPDLHRPFRTPLWIWLQWVVALLLMLIGLATLFSIAQFGAAPSVGVLACIAAAVTLADWSLRRRVAAGTRRQPSGPTTRRSGHA